MKAMAAYRSKDTKPTTIAYVIDAPDTNTKNGLFLKFAGGHLVEIASMKSEMNKTMYDTYMVSLLDQANTNRQDKNPATGSYARPEIMPNVVASGP